MDSPATWPALLSKLIRAESLSAAEAAWAMNEIMDGAATPSQIAGFGIALRMKGETADEVGGLAQAMLDHAAPVGIGGPLADLVGTGGDRAHTVNISTMGTIIAAAAGLRMAKHGNRAATSACGTADVLEALGVVIDLPPAATEQLAAITGVVFLFAPLYHPAFRHAAVPRRPTAQAVGVADRRMGPVLAGVLAARDCSALVFHGEDGLDELTTTGPSVVWVVHEGMVSETRFDPATLGIGRTVPGDLRGGDPAHNASVVRAGAGPGCARPGAGRRLCARGSGGRLRGCRRFA